MALGLAGCPKGMRARCQHQGWAGSPASQNQGISRCQQSSCFARGLLGSLVAQLLLHRSLPQKAGSYTHVFYFVSVILSFCSALFHVFCLPPEAGPLLEHGPYSSAVPLQTVDAGCSPHLEGVP